MDQQPSSSHIQLLTKSTQKSCLIYIKIIQSITIEKNTLIIQMHNTERRFTKILPAVFQDKLQVNKEVQQIEMIVKSYSNMRNQLLKKSDEISEETDSQQDQKYSVKHSVDQNMVIQKAKNQGQSHPKNSTDSQYDIRDLTYTMITANIPIVITLILFIILVVIRYYTIITLIDIAITSHGKHILWLIVVIGDRIIYFILVVKISLKSAETKTQITLKSHWNSKQSQINQIFSNINFVKLRKSIFRGMIPAQLAFLYITAAPRKKFQLYVSINYIFASIECVIYYPFFLGYTIYVGYDEQYDKLDEFFNGMTLGLSSLAQLIMIALSFFLLMLGIKRKRGKLLCC